MTAKFEYTANDRLPALAWLARVRGADGACSVVHGPLVEVADTCFCEGAWAGDFRTGDLARTEIVFGTGAVVEGDGVLFVSSLATTDYLYYEVGGDVVRVSNSLALLLADSEDALDPRYLRYADVNNSILDGIERYERRLPTRRGHVMRLMHHNLLVRQGTTAERAKVAPPSFESYDAYHAYLARGYAALAANARDAARVRPLKVFSTQSRGYDTTAINGVAAPHGLDGVFTVRTGKGGGSTADHAAEREVDDDGTEIAHALGVASVIGLERRAFAREFDDEIYYHASMHECQDANLKQLTEHIEVPALLLTGILGELWYTYAAWYWERPEFMAADLRKLDLAGHGLTEVRLRAGYVQAAVPFIGARRREQICAITESAEMTPWRLGTTYDRPIPRRIGEEAGLSRLAFGQVKIGSVVEFAVPQTPQSADLRARYHAFLVREGLLRRWQLALLPLVRAANEVMWFASPETHRLTHLVMRVAGRVARLAHREWRTPVIWNRLRGSLFCFAVNECVEEYRRALR